MEFRQSFLAKFAGLHEGEEQLRARSLSLLEADEAMRAHAATIELGQDVLNILIHDDAHRDDDDLTIRLLGIRLFNACAASMNLLLGGYYQNATFQLRDILETAFLLDFLRSDVGLVAEWRTSDKKARKKKFSPIAIRSALDDRDGFTERKREEAYSLLCELASHPTIMGFQMLRPDGQNAVLGPFLEEKALKAIFSELARLQIQSVGNFMIFFDWTSGAVAEAKVEFMATQDAWFTRFYERPPQSAMTAQLRHDLAQMRLAKGW